MAKLCRVYWTIIALIHLLPATNSHPAIHPPPVIPASTRHLVMLELSGNPNHPITNAHQLTLPQEGRLPISPTWVLNSAVQLQNRVQTVQAANGHVRLNTHGTTGIKATTASTGPILPQSRFPSNVLISSANPSSATGPILSHRPFPQSGHIVSIDTNASVGTNSSATPTVSGITTENPVLNITTPTLIALNGICGPHLSKPLVRRVRQTTGILVPRYWPTQNIHVSVPGSTGTATNGYPPTDTAAFSPTAGHYPSLMPPVRPAQQYPWGYQQNYLQNYPPHLMAFYRRFFQRPIRFIAPERLDLIDMLERNQAPLIPPPAPQPPPVPTTPAPTTPPWPPLLPGMCTCLETPECEGVAVSKGLPYTNQCSIGLACCCESG